MWRNPRFPVPPRWEKSSFTEQPIGWHCWKYQAVLTLQNSDRQREVVWRRRHFCCSPRVSSEISGELTSWLKFASVCRVKARFWTSQNEGNLDSTSLLLGSINGPCEKGESCCRVFDLVWMKGSLCFEWTWFLIVFSDFLPTNFDFLPRF